MSADNISYLGEGDRPTAHYSLYAQDKNDLHIYGSVEMRLALLPSLLIVLMTCVAR